MNGERLDHIRADVRQAILEAQEHDPTVALEILWRLFDRVAELACDAGADDAELRLGKVRLWAEMLLNNVQLRAISKTPYGEMVDDDLEDHRDQPRA